MEKTKTLAVVTTELRNFSVVETNWERYPYFYKVTSPMTIVLNNKNFNIKDVFKDDYIVWNKDNTMLVMRQAVWDKIYGEFLKTYMKENFKGVE